MTKISLLSLTIAIALTSGCASIMHGTTQKIGISSSPSGAKVTVGDKVEGETPLFAELDRGTEHIVKIDLPGFETAEMTLTKSVSGWVWGNIVFGGIIGLVVDASTGGLYELSPAQLNAELQESGSTTSMNENGLVVMVVLTPKKEWKKIARLERM